MKLVLENPFAGHNVGTRGVGGGARDECPSAVINESLEFFVHSSTPVRVSQSTAIISRYG
jgi:hypothetical protein